MLNAREFVEQYQEYTDRALRTANRYDVMAREYATQLIETLGIKGGTYDSKEAQIQRHIFQSLGIRSAAPRPTYEDMYDTVEFETGFFTASFEYNSACHCHPEYCTHSIKLPIEWLDLENEDDLRKAVRERLDAKYETIKEHIAAEAAEECQKKKQQQAKKEQDERETFARLKAKYEK
jgi:hypothetical protein